ncbi:Protein byr4 [Sphaceloma murrayae]|uniref:Protein byr4 n=1 Tax=Sphaceloma murrayae TaxID=2082308 RepID=A0A2K1QRJ4_9PEZI|nr:Protein byr4 [Sphaceloma murrayae]
MSRNLLKNFRRKSSGNALDLQSQQQSPQESSSAPNTFKVFERPEKADPRNRASTIITGRPGAYPLQHPAVKSADNLGYNLNRGSGGTTNSASSGYYDNSGSSARHSSSSTLPSSLDADHDIDGGDLFSIRKNKTAPLTSGAPEPPPHSFTARAGRALSFGLNKSGRNSVVSPAVAVPSVPYPNSYAGTPPSLVRPRSDKSGSDESTRERAMTTSSYASTARPPQLDSSIGTTDFGGDFENIFSGMNKKEDIPPVPAIPQTVKQVRSAEHSIPASPVDTVQQNDELFPPRTSSRINGSPSPSHLERPKTNERRFSWDSRKSNENLMSADSSELNSPNTELFPASAKPTGAAALASLAGIRGYEPLNNRYASPEPRDPRDSPTSNSGFLSAQSHRESNRSQESLGFSKTASRERLAWASERRPSPAAEGETRSSSRPGLRKIAASNGSQDRLSNIGSDTVVPSHNGSSYDEDAADRTPRARKSIIESDAAHIYGSSPIGPTSNTISPTKQRAMPATTPKKMTRQQFEQAKKMRNTVYQDDEESKSGESDMDDFEDEDEAQRQKQIAAQRRRQEASMSVYRQQMKKTTAGGSNISDLPSQMQRPPMERASLSNLAPGASSSGSVSPAEPAEPEEDDDVPLGILQAHGFPSKTRPPTHLPGAQPGYASSVAGDVGRGPMPAFARKLPQDPYFGAGLVNPVQREPLAFNSAGSVYGGPVSPHAAPGPPGGLVGVIASEERAKANRRGSPNPVTGGYGPIPLPNGLQGNPQMPGYHRTNSMASLAPPQMGMGGFYPNNGNLPGMPPMSPAEQANASAQQQMAQLMQMQTQMMQQMMAMQAGQMTGQMPSPMALPYPMPSSSMQSLQNHNGFLQTPPHMNGIIGMNGMTGMNGMQGMNGNRPISTVSTRPPSLAGQGRSMTMMHPPSNWGGENLQGRSNTMTGRPQGGYAGSVYGLNPNQGGPRAGYQPSIAPSERSNIGMPSRYRPVSIMDGGIPNNNNERRAKTMTATSFNPHSLPPIPRSLSPFAHTNGNTTAQKPKTTIRIIDKLKGTKSNVQRQEKHDDDDDDAGWARLAKKREAMRQKRANKSQSNDAAIADLYHGLDD